MDRMQADSEEYLDAIIEDARDRRQRAAVALRISRRLILSLIVVLIVGAGIAVVTWKASGYHLQRPGSLSSGIGEEDGPAKE